MENIVNAALFVARFSSHIPFFVVLLTVLIISLRLPVVTYLFKAVHPYVHPLLANFFLFVS